MHIAIFTDSFYPEMNGISYVLISHLKYLTKNFRVTLICPRYGGKYKELSMDNLTIYRLNSFALPTNKHVHTSFPRRCTIENIFKEQPDIVHVHTPGGVGLQGASYAKRHGKKLVLTFHTLITEQLGYLSILHQLGFNKLKHNVKRAIAWKLLQYIYNKGDLIIAPTNIIKKTLEEHNVLSPVKVIYNGIELKDYTPKQEYNKKNRIVTFGRISYEKNIDVIINALKLTEDAHLNKDTHLNIHLDIIGIGPDEKRLKNLTQKLGLGKKVQFLGFFERNKLNAAIKEHDAVVFASTMDTYCLSLIESMALGMPCIGADSYSFSELIKDKKTGFKVKPNDSKSMAQYIKMLVGDQGLREKLGRNARIEAEKHDIKKIMKEMTAIYCKLLE